MLLFDLGVVCKQNGKLERAIHWLGRAVACAPTLTAAHACLGEAYLAVGRVDAALDSFRLAVRQDPSDVLALNQLGSALHEVELPHEALAAFRCALALNRDSLAARLGAGTSMCAVEDYESAIGQFEAAIALDDQCAPAWYNLGCCRLGLGQYDAAVEAFTRVLGLHPGWAAAHLNRALAWLSAGDFERGLPEYEWRLGAIDKDFDSAPPRWDGSPLADKVLLIYAEQGLGDTVHFIRFVPSARALADKLILQVQPAILPLIEPLAAQWDITIVDADSEVPADVSCPLMSLPHILGVSLATLSATPLRAPLTAPPAATPYIQVPNAYREKWRGRLNHLGRRKIGLAWLGHRRTYDIRQIPAATLEPLFAMESVDWVVLQTDLSEADRQYLEVSPYADRIHVYQDQIADLADTAALIEQLDAVASVDTSIAHLAGAMQAPLLVMLPFSADWRWRIDTHASRWYPSARLLRQDCPGDWSSVVNQVATMLSAGPRPQ